MTVAVAGLACVPAKPPPPEPSVLISTDPALFPSFSIDVIDYVSRCSASAPVHVSVDAPSDTTVSVNGMPPQSGSFTTDVTRDVGQSFPIVVQVGSDPPTSHSVRCLPADFPNWTATRSGPTQAEWYVMAPITTSTVKYPTVFDNNGVPVWWSGPTNTGFDTLLPDDNIAWTRSTGEAEEHALDGSLVRTINPTIGTGDLHDLLLLPNGDYVRVTNVAKLPVGPTPVDLPAGQTVLDQVVQELRFDPNNPTNPPTVVWSWDTMDHIPVSEMDPQWFDKYITHGSQPYDVYHWNSIEYTGSGFILSFRHLDAIYNVKQDIGHIDDGAILWKLGGTSSPRPESLAVSGDPVFSNGGEFCGQHDARLLGDGTVTIHDNGTNCGRAPRAVRYSIDTTTTPGTATLQEQVDDALVSSSGCCGSARKLPGGNWVMGWGQNPIVTEMTASGASRVFDLVFTDQTFLYRAEPVPFGVLSRDALRAGMDAQYGTPPPGSTATPRPATPSTTTAPPATPTTQGF